MNPLDPEPVVAYWANLQQRARDFGAGRDHQGGLARSIMDPVRPASADDRCALRRNHRLHVGETMVYVPGVGFCCELCAL